jgi:hypothetical protein
MDIETINAVLKIIDEMLKDYPPGSEGALALWKLKERLSQ